MKRRIWMGALFVVAAVVAAVVFRKPLLGWFEPGAKPAEAMAMSGPAQAAPPTGYRFSASGLETLQLAYGSYQQIRAELAHDSTARLAELGGALGRTLHEVASHETAAPAPLRDALTAGAKAADALAATKELKTARSHFGELSRALVSVAGQDPRVADGWVLFECPMVSQGYNRWLQPDHELENPYMGTKMLKCGSEQELRAASASDSSSADANAIAFYTCPMHPSVRAHEKGQCPICGMDLVPVTVGDVQSGTVTVDEVRRQQIGVKVDKVTRAPLVVTVRTVGEVKYDETTLHDVSLKVGGWIRGIQADATGQKVTKGQVLFNLYSPDLFAAQQEYLLALKTHGGDVNAPLVQAARQRLLLWDVTSAQLDALAKRGKPTETLAIRAPASGYLVEKNVVDGAAVEPGARLYRIAALDRVWIEAQVYEHELPFMKPGMPVEVTLPFVPGRKFEGRISYVYPYLMESTRTGQVRIELPNAEGLLRPQMYADVTFSIDRGVRLQVPASAVIYTGPRRLVFVDLGEGRLRPREVKLGIRNGDAWEVLDGLKEGDRVVTSGNFLIAAESRLRSAAQYWGDDHER